ncbi:MAG: 2-keto-4-pentenoate hydratase, partial [Brevundimonas sp.]|nr:2-keto-4-pentenoate hydratase [Brevundimonas sp.]
MSTTAQDAARRLRDAYQTGAVAPLRDALEPQDIAGAYAVQAENTQVWISQGRRVVGRKVGLTAKAVQAQLGVDQPDFGVLFDDMAIPDGGRLDPAKVLQPKAEAEVAFILGADLLDTATSPEAAAQAVAEVVAAIEIVDSRIADWKIGIVDTVADNASCGVFALGSVRLDPRGIDLPGLHVKVTKNGVPLSEG